MCAVDCGTVIPQSSTIYKLFFVSVYNDDNYGGGGEVGLECMRYQLHTIYGLR